MDTRPNLHSVPRITVYKSTDYQRTQIDRQIREQHVLMTGIVVVVCFANDRASLTNANIKRLD